MLSRRRLLIGTVSTLALATPALAQDDRATRQVVRQLERQGFRIVQINRTLLGRVRVVARRGDLTREIVLDPRNGQILRDYVSGGDDDERSPDIGDFDDEDDDDDGEGGDDDDDDDDDDSEGGGGDDDSEGGGGDDDDDDD